MSNRQAFREMVMPVMERMITDWPNHRPWSCDFFSDKDRGIRYVSGSTYCADCQRDVMIALARLVKRREVMPVCMRFMM